MTSPNDYEPCARCGRVRNTNATLGDLCRDCHTVKPPRPAPPRAHQLAGYSIKRAQSFACLVRDEGRDGIGDFLDALTMQQLYGMTVALAAMVPVDQPAHDLLAWIHGATEVAA